MNFKKVFWAVVAANVFTVVLLFVAEMAFEIGRLLYLSEGGLI